MNDDLTSTLVQELVHSVNKVIELEKEHSELRARLAGARDMMRLLSTQVGARLYTPGEHVVDGIAILVDNGHLAWLRGNMNE